MFDKGKYFQRFQINRKTKNQIAILISGLYILKNIYYQPVFRIPAAIPDIVIIKAVTKSLGGFSDFRVRCNNSTCIRFNGLV